MRQKKTEPRGLRTPLGHKNGLTGEFALLDIMKRLGIKYVSSDLRDDNDSLHPKLFNKLNEPRQPYRYENGLLEIPSIGWQDTVFSRTSKTKLFEPAPTNYNDILNYYSSLFNEALELAQNYDRDIFLGLVLHPYDTSFYDKGGTF